MRLTKKSLLEIKEKFYNIFCLISAEPVSEKWATCYNCHVALRVISHLPMSGFLNKSVSQPVTPLGVCLEISIPIHKLISIIDFERPKHVILCLKCLGDSFLAIDGSLFTRCMKCLSFFNNVEPEFDGMYWEAFQGTEYDMHVAYCKTSRKGNIFPIDRNLGSHLPTLWERFSPKKLTKIKPFLLRKDQIK